MPVGIDKCDEAKLASQNGILSYVVVDVAAPLLLRPTWQPPMTNELLSQWVNSHRIFLDDDDDDDDDDDEQEGVKTATPAACRRWI